MSTRPRRRRSGPRSRGRPGTPPTFPWGCETGRAQKSQPKCHQVQLISSNDSIGLPHDDALEALSDPKLGHESHPGELLATALARVAVVKILQPPDPRSSAAGRHYPHSNEYQLVLTHMPTGTLAVSPSNSLSAQAETSISWLRSPSVSAHSSAPIMNTQPPLKLTSLVG